MRSFYGLAMVAVLTLSSVVTARAEDPCKAKCDDWIASCNDACTNAPVLDECKTNCRTAYDKCMSDCGLSPKSGQEAPSGGGGGY